MPAMNPAMNDTFDTFQLQPRGSSDFWFACVDIDVMRDKTLSPCDKTVFAVVCTHANVQIRDCHLRVRTIAEEANCSVRSTQESLKALAERGVIERVECFVNGKQRASVYKIVGHNAPCYRGAESAPVGKDSAPRGADFAPTVEFCTPRGAENDVPELEQNINNIKDLSPSESLAAGDRYDDRYFDRYEEKNGTPSLLKDLIDSAPSAMRETLDYFLLKTGRGGVSEEELSALYALDKIHSSGRVNKEIANACERFKERNEPLHYLTVTYIYKSLQYQHSCKKTKDKAPPRRETNCENSREGYFYGSRA